MKTANVRPIFKGGDPQHLGNYRPMSVLNVFSKLLEKMVSKRLRNFLDSNEDLYSKQFGFRTKYSTEMALLTAVDFITGVEGKIWELGHNAFSINSPPLSLVFSYILKFIADYQSLLQFFFI